MKVSEQWKVDRSEERKNLKLAGKNEEENGMEDGTWNNFPLGSIVVARKTISTGEQKLQYVTLIRMK